jgi:5'-3' exonuclease
MGIPRFFYWVYNNHRECLVSLLENETFQTRELEVDCYALDINALIHPVCQKMYNYGSGVEKNNSSRLLHRKNNEKIRDGNTISEKNVFYEICKTIENLRKIVKPRKKFILAIDGTAGLSKQNQQRQRRFKSSVERDSVNIFDSNCITTGSVFMYNFSRYLHTFIKKQLETNPAWKDLEIVFSNEKVVGEGEHKIIKYIKQDSSEDSYCIHSPDADLIMLTVGIVNKSIYIIRENIYNRINCKYFVVDVSRFRTIILSHLRWVSTDFEYNSEMAIYDFILLCFFLGNDFLPHTLSLDIATGGIEILLDVYPRIAMNNGHFVYKKDGLLCLNTKSLHSFFYSLSLKENQLLEQKVKENIKYPDTILLSNTKITILQDGRQESQLNFCKYREEYYSMKLKNIEISDVCHEYFKGLLFVLRYYIDEIPDWHWMYPFHYPPFFTDMYRYIQSFDGETKFNKHQPLTPFEQLLAVLPPQSKNLLPESCKKLMEPDSEIYDFYPSCFKIDMEGKRSDWEGYPILPFVNVSRLQAAFEKVKDKLTDDEVQRNQYGKTIKYCRKNGNIKSIFI